MQKYQKKKTHPGKEPLLERAETGGTFPGKGCGTPGTFHTDTAKVYAFLCSRRAGGMTGYRYAPVRVRSFRPDCSCVYGILVRKLEGERTVALTVIPGLSPDKEAVHRFAEWCGREQLDPARLPEAIRAAFPDTVKTP